MNRRIDALTWLGLALVVAIGLMVALGTLTMSTYAGTYGMMSGGAWGWGVVMMGVPAVILVVILLAALGGLGQPSVPVTHPAPTATPMDILDERYARGEVSREEYLRAREDLGPGRAQA